MIKYIKITCFSMLMFSIILSCFDTKKEERINRIYISGDTNLIKEKINRIENGLMHAVLLADQPVRTFTIEERMSYYDVPGLSVAIINKSRIAHALQS